MRPSIRIATTIGFAFFLLVGIPVIVARGGTPATPGANALRILAFVWLAALCIVIPLSLWCREPRALMLKRVAAGLVGSAFLIGAVDAVVDALYALPKQGPDLRIVIGLSIFGAPCLIFAFTGRLPKPRSATRPPSLD
jgi:hypothetical protein